MMIAGFMPVAFLQKPTLRVVIFATSFMLALIALDLLYEYPIIEVVLFACVGISGFLVFMLWQRQQKILTAAEASKALEQRNALLAAAIESSPAGVVIADATKPNNPILFVNKSFTTITGYSAEEVTGKSCQFLQGIHTNKDDIRALNAALKARQPVEMTLLNYRKDQTPFWNEMRISPLFDADGAIKNFIALQTDVTAMHNTQEALKIAKEQAERVTSVKSNFMAMMSHEVRTPINGILGTLALLNDMPLSMEAKQLAETSYQSASALLTIVNDMLDFSKIEAGKLDLEVTDFDLHALVDGCLTLMQPIVDSKKISLMLDFDASVPKRVASDPTRIKQVLLNLISNAVKFTEKGGVTVRVSNLMAASKSGTSDAIVRFEVIDTGIGMSQDGMTRIFTEFNQLDPSIARRYGGTGLGLAICKRLISMMNGEIEVESRQGEGSKFWFVLPLRVAEAAASEQPQTPLNLALHGSGKILIVEDNTTNQFVLTKMLERAGYTCHLAENGAIGIEKVRSESFDLVFMDVSMPVMDGLTATRQIRALGGKYATLPIIAMTAQSMSGDRERCLGAGMNDYLSKPVDRQAMLQTLQHWLTSKAAANTDASAPVNDNSHGASQDGTLNWQVLRQMATDVGQDAVGRLLGVFEMDLKRRIQSFQSALAAEDWLTLERESHTLKSSCASCGLQKLSERMQAIEVALHNGDTSAAITQASAVDPLVTAAQTALKHAQSQYQGENRP